MEIYYIIFSNICMFKVFYNKVFFKMANKSNYASLVSVVILVQLRCGRALALAAWGLRTRCQRQTDRSSNPALPGQWLERGYISYHLQTSPSTSDQCPEHNKPSVFIKWMHEGIVEAGEKAFSTNIDNSNISQTFALSNQQQKVWSWADPQHSILQPSVGNVYGQAESGGWGTRGRRGLLPIQCTN